MSVDQKMDSSRRTLLLATSAAGGVAAVATAVPFVASLTPSERAKAAGAVLVQTYTGLIYRGPALIGECVDALRRRKEAPSRGHLPPE